MALHRGCSRFVWIRSIVVSASLALGSILFSLGMTYNSIDVEPPLSSAPPMVLHTRARARNMSQQDRAMTTQKYDLLPNIDQDTVMPNRSTTHSRYLVYFSHSGFGNQIISLRNAAILAYSTNRTLVLPPLLPHRPKDKPKIFKNYKAQTAGGPCIPYTLDAKFIEVVKTGADAAGDGQLFPSFSELVDFNEIEKQSGIHFVDLPDFMNEKNHSTQFWHEGKRRKVDYDGQCTLNYTRTYPDMVKVFEDNFSTDPTIAVIGSAFIIGNKPENLGFSDEQLFLGFSPSKKVLHIIKKMRKRLSQHYHGVHIRFLDKQKFDCKDLEITEMFHSIMQEAQHNLTATGETTMFVGFSHPNLKICMTEYCMNSTCNVMFLEDLMDEDLDIQSLINNVRVEKGTLYLLLDQLLIALADHIMLRSFMAGSTFQVLIEVQHRYKDDILSQLE